MSKKTLAIILIVGIVGLGWLVKSLFFHSGVIELADWDDMIVFCGDDFSHVMADKEYNVSYHEKNDIFVAKKRNMENPQKEQELLQLALQECGD